MLTLWPYIRTNKSRHPRHVFHEALSSFWALRVFSLEAWKKVSKNGWAHGFPPWKNRGWTTEMEIEPSKIKIEPWKNKDFTMKNWYWTRNSPTLTCNTWKWAGLTPQVMDIKSERCWFTWWNGQFRGWSLEDFKGFIDLVMDLQGWWWWCWPSWTHHISQEPLRHRFTSHSLWT